ncbi:MAG: hypothetical protein EBV06_08830 [Planctomycetia bacterium]|nr:hypothetical protein [Planctomycetia bacterium]
MLLGGSTTTPFDLIFTLFGTRVRVHPFFWLISVLLGQGILSSPNWMELLITWIAAVFLSILLHEFGHVWMWRVFGVRADILLHSMGGLAIPDYDAPKRWQRILVSFAGPAIQLILYAILSFGFFHLWKESLTSPILISFIAFLMIINLSWPLINLLPIYPLDGGQMVRELCQMVATRSEMVNSRPALIVSLWISIGTALAVTLYILMPNFGYRQPINLPVGPFMAVVAIVMAVNNYQELQQMSGRRGPLDDDW